MVEQDKVEETRARIHEWLRKETDPEMKKREKKASLAIYLFMIIVGASMGSAAAIWKDIALVFDLGSLVCTTAGALVIALGAIPSDKTILDMGVTYISGNKSLVSEIRKNRLYARWGIYLIIIGYVLFSVGLGIRVTR